MPCTRPAARSRCRSCTPGATPITRCRSRRRALRSPITPFKPRALTRWGVAQDDRRLRALRAARAARGLRRRRDHGLRGLSDQPVRRAAHQPPRRRMGRRASTNRIRFPGRDRAQRRARRSARDFIIIYRLSMLDLVDGGSTWDEVVALGKAVEAAGATLINTGIGWHEARDPDHRDDGAARGVRVGHARLRARSRFPLIATNRINDPAVAEAMLARGDADMVSMARPFLADAEFVAKAARARRRDQHLHRLQPGVPRPDLRAPDRLVPRQSACLPRDRNRDREGRAQQAHRRRRRRPGGLACATTAAEARPSR